MSEKKLKNRVQVYNSRNKMWVKFDTTTGRIVANKKTQGPYSNIRIQTIKRVMENN